MIAILKGLRDRAFSFSEKTCYALKSACYGFGSGFLDGLQLGLGIFAWRDYLITQHLKQYGHQCELTFPVGYSCQDRDIVGVEDAPAFLSATIQTYPYFISVVVGTALTKAIIRGVHAYEHFGEEEHEQQFPPKALISETALGMVQGFSYGILTSYTLFYYGRECLPVFDQILPTALNFDPKINEWQSFRIFNEEACTYFNIYASIIISHSILSHTGKRIINATWDRLSQKSQFVIEETKKSYVNNRDLGLKMAFLAFFPVADCLFSNKMNSEISCPLRFPIAFKCNGLHTEFNDDAFGLSYAESLKYGIFFYGPVLIFTGNLLGAGFAALQAAKKEPPQEPQETPSHAITIAPETEYKLLTPSDNENSYRPDCFNVIKKAAKFCVYGTIFSYGLFYVSRFIDSFIVYKTKGEEFAQNMDAIYRHTTNQAIQIFEIAAPIVISGVTLCGIYRAKQDRSKNQKENIINVKNSLVS